LRFTFVVAAHLVVRLTPQVLRALHLELFTEPSSRRLFTKASRFILPNQSPLPLLAKGGWGDLKPTKICLEKFGID
jgi:hypothetical protein